MSALNTTLNPERKQNPAFGSNQQQKNHQPTWEYENNVNATRKQINKKKQRTEKLHDSEKLKVMWNTIIWCLRQKFRVHFMVYYSNWYDVECVDGTTNKSVNCAKWIEQRHALKYECIYSESNHKKKNPRKLSMSEQRCYWSSQNHFTINKFQVTWPFMTIMFLIGFVRNNHKIDESLTVILNSIF